MARTIEQLSDFIVHPRAKAPLMRSKGTELQDVYGRYSDKKEKAMAYCKNLCRKYSGENLCITGHNCDQFTVMFDFPHPVTGELLRAVITKDYNQAYYL